MDEFTEITDYIQEESGYSAELITGYGIDQSLGDNVNVTIIATGFQSNNPTGFEAPKKIEKEIVSLAEEVKSPVQEITTPTKAIEVSEIPLAKSTEEPFLIVKQEIAQEPTKIIETPSTAQSELSEKVILDESNVVSWEIKPVEKTEITEEITEQFTEDTVEEEPIFEAKSIEIQGLNNDNENEQELTEELNFIVKTSEEIVFTTSQKEEPIIETEKSSSSLTPEEIAKIEREEKIKAAQERIKRLKDISLKLKSPEGLHELEKEPSFVRQNVKIEDNNYSTESKVSRYTLSEGDDKRFEIKPNNPFLHDNVD